MSPIRRLATTNGGHCSGVKFNAVTASETATTIPVVAPIRISLGNTTSTGAKPATTSRRSASRADCMMNSPHRPARNAIVIAAIVAP